MHTWYVHTCTRVNMYVIHMNTKVPRKHTHIYIDMDWSTYVITDTYLYTATDAGAHYHVHATYACTIQVPGTSTST